MVSIVTATFNSQKTIERVLKSVLDQTGCDLEHIIVDGGSTDETIGIIESYRKDYTQQGKTLKVISEKDSGPYDAMNKGILMARGEFIGVLNSDDSYEKRTVERINSFSERKDIDIIMGAIRIHNGSHVIIKKAKDRKYRTSRDFNHPAMFVRRNCYDSVGLYRNDNVHADYGWFLKAVTMGKKLLVIDDILADFYVGGLSTPKSFGDMISRIRQKEEIYRSNGFSRFYNIECVMHEVMKYLLISK